MSMTERYKNIYEIIREIEPKTILEIGTWNGINAAQMIKCASEFEGIQIKYIGFDLFEEFDKQLAVEEFCPKPASIYKKVARKLHATTADVELYRGYSYITLPEWVKNRVMPVDFIFIDGGHSLETIEKDWASVQPIIGPKTVILFDDYYCNYDKTGCFNVITKIYNENQTRQPLAGFPTYGKQWEIKILPPTDHVPSEITPDKKLIINMVRVQLAKDGRR